MFDTPGLLRPLQRTLIIMKEHESPKAYVAKSGGVPQGPMLAPGCNLKLQAPIPGLKLQSSAPCSNLKPKLKSQAPGSNPGILAPIWQAKLYSKAPGSNLELQVEK